MLIECPLFTYNLSGGIILVVYTLIYIVYIAVVYSYKSTSNYIINVLKGSLEQDEPKYNNLWLVFVFVVEEKMRHPPFVLFYIFLIQHNFSPSKNWRQAYYWSDD